MLSLLSGALSGAWLYVLVAITAGAGAGYLVHELDAAKLESVELGDARAQTEAVTLAASRVAAQDKVTTASAVAEAAAQVKVVTQVQTVTKRIPVYVTQKQDASSCITYGLVRVYNESVGEASANAIPVPTGQSYDSCSPVKASQLAAGIADNFGAANANAEQLTALQGWVSAQAALPVPVAP